MSKKTSVAGDSHTKSKKKADTSDVVPAQVIDTRTFVNVQIRYKLNNFKAFFASTIVSANCS